MKALRFAIIAGLFCAVAPEARAQLRAFVYASGFSMPVGFVQHPSLPHVQFVVEQAGRIRVIQNGNVLPTDFLDLPASDMSCCGEQGLLGLAFAPDYATSGRFFVDFTNPAGNKVVSRFKVSSDPLVADPASRFDFHWSGSGGAAFISHPFFTNHNGGDLVFGPDSYLYIGLGDGGSGGDPNGNAQNPAVYLGKMLRIDVNVPDNNASGYQVPPDNPFVSSGPAGTLPEIWAFGLRNPWRYTFDDPARGGTGALVIGDVGQAMWEEIDYEPANHGGRNYGWRNREGAHDYDTSLPPAYLPLVDPIFNYDHTVGQAVVGGFVYRGHGLGAAYAGRYFFGDYSQGRVWSLGLTIDSGTGEAAAADLIEHTIELGGGALGPISSFGLDADGELYIVSISSGCIWKILAAGPTRLRDFDGDRRADPSTYRPFTGAWSIRQSDANYTNTIARLWGASGDIPVPADYDGDGIADIAVYRPSTGEWFILKSSTNYTKYDLVLWGGGISDVPVVGDYDGDGKADVAIYQSSTGIWFILPSSQPHTYRAIPWGAPTDVPVPADYDGDKRTDIAVYRPSTGVWYILQSSTNYSSYVLHPWGDIADIPVPGDYDGDGLADIAVYRPQTAQWFILTSSSGYHAYQLVLWGGGDDMPVVGDFDGDGRADVAIYRASADAGYRKGSTSGGFIIPHP